MTVVVARSHVCILYMWQATVSYVCGLDMVKRCQQQTYTYHDKSSCEHDGFVLDVESHIVVCKLNKSAIKRPA